MNSTPKKVLLAAIICYAGSLVSCYISQLPSAPDVFVPEGAPWTALEYSSLILLMCGLGLTIAAIKFRR